MQEMIEILICMEITEESLPKINKLSQEGFMMLIGSLVDQYGADHGLSSENTCQMLDKLAIIQKQVHAELGMANPTT